MVQARSLPITDPDELDSRCNALIQGNKADEALALIKEHVGLVEGSFETFLGYFETDDHRLQFAHEFKSLTGIQIKRVLQYVEDDQKRLAFIVEKLAGIPDTALVAILSTIQTDPVRLEVARLFVSKLAEDTIISPVLKRALKTFEEDASRLEFAEIYQAKIDIYNIAYCIKAFKDQDNRLTIARKFKYQFAQELPHDLYLEKYLEILECLAEEQRFTFVKECLGFIPADLLPRVIGELKKEHRLAIALAYQFKFDTKQTRGDNAKLDESSSLALVEILPLLSQEDRLTVVKKYADNIDEFYLNGILRAFGNDAYRLPVLEACQKNISVSQFHKLVGFLESPVNRLKFALGMRSLPFNLPVFLSIDRVFPGVFSPKPNPQKLRQLAETEEMKAFIKQKGLLVVIELIFKEYPVQIVKPNVAHGRIEFLKAFSPAVLLEFVNSMDDWNQLSLKCGSADDVAACFGLRVGTRPNEQIDFLLAMKKLTSVCSGTQYPEHLKIAGKEVVRAFEEAYQSDALNTTKKLKQFKEVAELIIAVINSNNHNMQPFLDKLKADPIQLGDVRNRRVLGAIGAFICVALVAASITLALISFGVLAPLTIATITLSANLLTACLATAAAPVAFGLGTGAAFFACTCKKQGPALAVDEFVAQQKAVK